MIKCSVFPPVPTCSGNTCSLFPPPIGGNRYTTRADVFQVFPTVNKEWRLNDGRTKDP